MSAYLQHNYTSNNYTNNATSVGNNTDNVIYNKITGAPLFLSLYAIIFVLAVGGNCLVIWIVSTNRKMHELTINYLLVNLALADLIQTFSSIFHVADFVVKDLNIGDVGCKFQINMYNIPYGTSVLTLIFIAYERYCAVCKPAYFNEFKGRVRWFVPLAWQASACMNIPNIVYCGIRTDTKKNQLTCDCTERWPSLRAKSIYGIGVVVVLYVLPLVVTSRLYFLVIRRLRRSIPGEQQGTVTAYQSRQGVVKMLLVCVVLFFVAWTPYNVLFFLKRLQYDYRRIYKFVWYPALLLAFISCAFNPIVYCLLSKNFRKAVKSTLCCVIPRILRVSTSGTQRTRRQTARTNLTTN